jgi:glycolate oxidase
MSSPNRYNPVTPRIADDLRKIVGDRYVVHGEPEALAAYSHDEARGAGGHHAPEALVRPASAGEIAAIMKLANRERVPVTPRGAGSGLSGGAVPVCGGIVLLCDRMNRILEVDRGNMVAVVEPGVVTNDINAAVAESGLFYAGYPMSLETCYIGGNVAENAGGGKAVKYGVTARYVLGLEVVTPTGEIVQLGGKLVKDVTGYNLIQLLVGSEGTLGIFTKITLKLLPLPRSSVDLLCLFRTPEEAIAAVPRIMTAGGIIPTSIEFMDQPSFRAACEYLNERIPWQSAGAMLLITLDGPDEAQIGREYETIGELCTGFGATEVYVADNRTTSERLWKVRRNVGEALNLLGPLQCGEDVVVPPAAVAHLVQAVQELSRKYGVQVYCFGHAGDGNLHPRIIKNPAWSAAEWEERLPQILTDLYRLVASLGGRISGEHGIGHKRKQYMPLVVSREYIDLMRAIKRAWDPLNVLNPGKIFDV